jgi:hypothetical protein
VLAACFVLVINLAYSSTLKMETVFASETSVNFYPSKTTALFTKNFIYDLICIRVFNRLVQLNIKVANYRYAHTYSYTKKYVCLFVCLCSFQNRCTYFDQKFDTMVEDVPRDVFQFKYEGALINKITSPLTK